MTRCLHWAAFALLAIATFMATAAAAGGRTVVVVRSADLPVYAEALAGLETHLKAATPGVSIEVLDGAGKQDFEPKLRALRESKPDVIVALGSRAASKLAGLPEIPLVAGLLTDRASIRSLENATGVALAFSVETELDWVRRFAPEGRPVGVLYDPARNQDRITRAEHAAERLGIDLVTREVTTPEDIPRALRHVSRHADFLWGIRDSTVLTPQTAKSVLSFSYERRLPFSGLSQPWVEAGALYALDRDYRDLGAQCGELVVRLLDGASTQDLPPLRPRRVVYSINLRAARHLKLDLDESLIAGAAHVVK
jgi:putative ABC transport system substrate-binding protein